MPFAFNKNAPVKLTWIGRRGIPIVRIEDVLQSPEAVATLGSIQSYTQDRTNLYPGIRAAMPETFSIAFRAWLTPILQRCGVLQGGRTIYRDSSFFSVVTTASQDLLPIQCIPHYDSTDPSLFAAVLYLCDTRFSGTSFYRHRNTDYDEITAANQENYRLALDNDLRRHGVPRKEYMNGDTALFEVLHSNELQFNSAVIYPGRVLHAANIEKQLAPPRDPSEWRLTITALLEAGG